MPVRTLRLLILRIDLCAGSAVYANRAAHAAVQHRRAPTPFAALLRCIAHLAHEGVTMKALLSAAVAVALSASAAAHAGSLVDVSVIDRDTGRTLTTHAHDGKLYVAGTPGHRYAVRLYNRSGARVLTVLS